MTQYDIAMSFTRAPFYRQKLSVDILQCFRYLVFHGDYTKMSLAQWAMYVTISTYMILFAVSLTRIRCRVSCDGRPPFYVAPLKCHCVPGCVYKNPSTPWVKSFTPEHHTSDGLITWPRFRWHKKHTRRAVTNSIGTSPSIHTDNL